MSFHIDNAPEWFEEYYTAVKYRTADEGAMVYEAGYRLHIPEISTYFTFLEE